MAHLSDDETAAKIEYLVVVVPSDVGHPFHPSVGDSVKWGSSNSRRVDKRSARLILLDLNDLSLYYFLHGTSDTSQGLIEHFVTLGVT
jgi:hypothetical protein